MRYKAGLFQSLVSNLPTETILEVWNIRATGTQRIGHYTILLDKASMITSRWYLNTDVELSDLLQQYPFIPICDKSQLEDDIPFQTMYVELSGLLKKAIDYAIKADMQHELLNIFKAFIYDI
ncbi:hypothetical protein RhiirA5_440957 [Rhizophagus irregularis]|uniref:Uncharacterized protein n=1 Tax=Rhizophagus irregularis TaxID=588596 RepID=A0A2N0NG71_9GLOM|nr:hypothetical protein RhiirA5_440957 [Rhizophagus irregularis]